MTDSAPLPSGAASNSLPLALMSQGWSARVWGSSPSAWELSPWAELSASPPSPDPTAAAGSACAESSR